MISKRIRILALVLVSCFCLLNIALGLQQNSISISNSGTISFIRSYICGNYNSTHYYAQNNVTGNYELISNDATQTISYALSKLTAGRTWQETVILKGDFSIGTTVAVNQGNLLLDCRQATLRLVANVYQFQLFGDDTTVLGGHWIGYSGGGGNNEAVVVSGTSITLDGLEMTGYINCGQGVIFSNWQCGGYLTVQNCVFHDNYNNGPINLEMGSYNKVLNCTFYNFSNGVFASGRCMYNEIAGCNFSNWNAAGVGHAIYLDSYDSPYGGNNTVHDNNFYNQTASNGAGLQIKCPNNKIYNNNFWNFTNAGAPCFSIYSQYSHSAANYNDIYNNTFADCDTPFWLGHFDTNEQPTMWNRIHDNVFLRCATCFRLQPWTSNSMTNSTLIYYNSMASCVDIFGRTEAAKSTVINTVVAYNTFSATVDSASVTELKSYTNTMIYGNSPWLADYDRVTDVNSPYYIRPP